MILNRQSQNGVLLLEIMVALSIVATGMLTAIYAFSYSASQAGLVRREATGIMLAREKMEEILNEKFLVVGIQEGSFDPDGDTPDLGAYRWTSQIELLQEQQGVAMYEVIITSIWTSRNTEQHYTLETLAARRQPTLPGK